jgi:hypothetical protein
VLPAGIGHMAGCRLINILVGSRRRVGLATPTPNGHLPARFGGPFHISRTNGGVDLGLCNREETCLEVLSPQHQTAMYETYNSTSYRFPSTRYRYRYVIKCAIYVLALCSSCGNSPPGPAGAARNPRPATGMRTQQRRVVPVPSAKAGR